MTAPTASCRLPSRGSARREIEVSSALALIDERDLDYYRRHSRRVADIGYDDPWVDEDGSLREARSAA